MRVFVTGASGWIGSAVVPDLVSAGHHVVGLARSDASAAALAGAGVEVRRGDLDDLDALRAGADDADAVVHLAFGHDFSRFQESIDAEGRVVEVLGEVLAGTGKALVIATGTPAVPGRVATESDRSAPGSPGAGREANAQAVLALAERGVRSSVVRLPRSVHGEGDRHGFVSQLIRMAREKGVSGYVGDGSARWPAVHVLDAGQLFRLAVERAEPGTMLHAVGDEGVVTGEIAQVIGRHVGVPVGAVPAEDMGFLGMLLAIDQPASAALTGERFGWEPSRPGLIDDLEKGHYFEQS